MKKNKNVLREKSLPRRSFLKLAGLSSVGLSMGFPLNTRWAEASTVDSNPITDANVWKTDRQTGRTYFVQNNLKIGRPDGNAEWITTEDNPHVLAKYDGIWWAYPVREYDDEFHTWWIYEKSWYYDRLIAFFNGESDTMEIPNGGHHHPMLSTYGSKFRNRGDSQFHLNTTPKGLTIIPKYDRIDYVNEQIDQAYDVGPVPVGVFQKRKELYQDKTLWDKTKFATLELYSGRPVDENDPGNQGGIYGIQETHTFQNLVANPMATLTYMSLFNTDGTQPYFGGTSEEETATFEFRGFCRLIDNYNPKNTAYELAIHNYINAAHCRYHGGSCELSTNIFIISEEFNNSPGYDPYARGKRVVPPPEPGLYETPENMVAARNEFKKKYRTTSEKIELLKKLRIPV